MWLQTANLMNYTVDKNENENKIDSIYVKPPLFFLHTHTKGSEFQICFFLIQRPKKWKHVIFFLVKKTFTIVIPCIMTQSPLRRGRGVLQSSIHILWKFVHLNFLIRIIWTGDMQLLCSNKRLLYWRLTCSLLGLGYIFIAALYNHMMESVAHESTMTYMQGFWL